MKKVGLLLLALAISIAFNASMTERAEALPAINTQFKKTFAKNQKLMAAAKEVKYCNVCHYGKSKKNRNDETATTNWINCHRTISLVFFVRLGRRI